MQYPKPHLCKESTDMLNNTVETAAPSVVSNENLK